MPDTSQSPPSAPTPASDQSGVGVARDVEDSTPFVLNPAFISLGLKPDVFKQGVGGDAAQ
jgi:hypothetical protein